MNADSFDHEISVLKLKIAATEKKYQLFAEFYKERLVNSVGQSMRYAQINELLTHMHKILSMYNSVTEGIFEEFSNSLEADMGDTDGVNFKLREFSKKYGYDMMLVNQQVYLLNEEKRELEEKLGYKFPPIDPSSPETDPASPDDPA